MRWFTSSSLTLVVAVATSAGLAGPAWANTDNRPLPPARNVAVDLDDSLVRVQSMFPRSKVVDARITRHRGKWVNQIQTFRGTQLRTVRIDLATDRVLSNTQARVTGQRLNNLRQTVRLLNTVATTRAEAILAAEAAVPGAKVYEVELDDFNDRPVFKVKMLDGARRVIVIVGADTGEVVPMPGDGVRNVSIDDAQTAAIKLFEGWTLIKIEVDDDRGFDDSGQFYHLRLVSPNGTQRRDVKLNANSGGVGRDRISPVNGGNVNDFARIAAAGTPAVSFGKAAMIAAESVSGSRVHEVQLKFEGQTLVYEVDLITGPGGGGDDDGDDDNNPNRTQVKVNATTGAIVTPGGGQPGTGISSSQAAAIALARVPGATVREISLDTEHGVPVYEVKLISAGGVRTDVKVAIATGEVVKVDVDDDNDDDDNDD